MRRLWTTLSLILIASTLSTVSAQTRAPSRMERMDRLEVGVEREEAIRAIKRLQHTYNGYLDNGLWNEIASLLSSNAAADFAGTKVTSSAAIASHLRQQADRAQPGLANGQLNTHLLMQPIINLGADGKTAKGTWHELAMLGRNAGRSGATASWIGGIYENTYVLENGAWKISSIGFHEQYRGDYSEPGQKAPPTWDIPYHFEAAHVGLTIPPSALVATDLTNKTANQSDTVRTAQVTARLNRMEDETAVQNLQHMYGYYLDRKHFDDIADLFAKGGTWNGKTNVRVTLESLYGAPAIRFGELFDHLLLGTVATVAPDGRTAMARSTELAQIGLQNEFARWELGIYENRFVKEDGVWKLQSLNYYKRLVTNYDQGWAKEGLGEFAFPAFHYANPVTGKTPRYPMGAIQVPTVPTAAAKPPQVASNDAAVTAALAAAEHSLARAIGVDASENLNSAYGYYLDESAWDAVADMMSNKGVFDLSSVGIYLGRERARKALHLRYPNSGRGPAFFTIHQLVQPVTHISEDGRVARSRLRLVQSGGSANGSSGSWIGGTYENRAVLEDGEWKFYEKDLQHAFSATQKDGWAKVAAPRAAPNTKAPAPAPNTKAKQPSVAAQFPPDLPERTEQYAFPQVAEPSYHYVNPVSGRKPPILLEAPPIP
ncbi:MAG: nuclear transport factor 2 family protein [Acidobacteriota bacterium]